MGREHLFSTSTPFLLVEQDVVGSILVTLADSRPGDDAAELAGLDVALVHDDAVVILKSGG